MSLRDEAYAKYFFGDTNESLTGRNLTPEEVEAYIRMAEAAWNKPTQAKGSLIYEDYPKDPPGLDKFYDPYFQVRTTIGRTGVDPRFNKNSSEASYIRREGNNWKIKDWYDFNSNNQIKPGSVTPQTPEGVLEQNHETALRLIADGIRNRDVGQFLQAANPISRLIKGDKHGYQVDISLPLSKDQLKRLGNNHLEIGEQRYIYEPYVFSPGETTQAAIRKAFANNPTYKPEGKNLERYTEIVEKRNKFRGGRDTSYYIPVPVKEFPPVTPPQGQKFRALDLIAKHLRNPLSNIGGF
jgi:hypothetical protein